MNKRSNQITAIVAIIALLIFAWDLGYKQARNAVLVDELNTENGAITESDATTSDEALPTGEVGTSPATSSAVGGEFVSVNDQKAGSQVQVASLTLLEMGWVGIRDKDGRVLGAGRFEAGSYKDVNVPLLRATVAGESYQALLYVDDGDRQFDLHKETLISGSNGGIAGTNFKAF
ncbi:MAG: hypothetical protein Q7S01_02700 [bacterium]|nr:hypothetical protein [bacterium]